jgi:UDP-glucose 4-epimerase
MKRFVVTGCNGYIGSHMCYELKKAYPDCWIHGIDRNEKQHLRSLYDIFSHIDLALDPIILSPFRREPIDAIFHFAALTSVEEGEMRPFEYYFNNLGASLRLIEEALDEKVPNFIFSSTAAVYGEQKGAMFGHLNEDMPMNAHSVYGKTKQAVEEVLSSVHHMNVTCLRYFNACGRNVEAGLYEEHDPETHLIPLLVRNKKAIIYGDNWPTKDGTCVRDYVHVIDICRAHLLAYKNMELNPGTNISINIGTGEGHSVREVADKVNSIIHNGTMEIETHSRREGDVAYLVASTQLANMILNFRSEYSLDDIIESMKNVNKV